MGPVVTHFVSRFLYFLHSILGRLWYAEVLSEPLATIEQYRISFNRNTMVVNDHFIMEGHQLQLSPYPGQVVTPHSIAWKVISELNWTKILVYSSALQSNKVQSSMEKFYWLKKLRKTDNFLLFFFSSDITAALKLLSQRYNVS